MSCLRGLKRRGNVPLHLVEKAGCCECVAGDLNLLFFQLSATQRKPASHAALSVPMNYTWAPLRHLTAGSSGTYQQQLQPGRPCVPAY